MLLNIERAWVEGPLQTKGGKLAARHDLCPPIYTRWLASTPLDRYPELQEHNVDWL